jgi:hypothetical protein
MNPEHLLMSVINKKNICFFPLFFSLFTEYKKELKVKKKDRKMKKINFIEMINIETKTIILCFEV